MSKVDSEQRERLGGWTLQSSLTVHANVRREVAAHAIVRRDVAAGAASLACGSGETNQWL